MCACALPAGLEALDLSSNAFTHLPPVLAAATRLCRLTLCDNSELRVTLADVDSILAPLAQLRRLDMDWWRCCAPPVIVHLFRRLPQLAAPNSWYPAQQQPAFE